MATFVTGQEVVTTTPTVTVDGGLAAGTYRFQLIVEDASDRTRPPVQSTPQIVTLVVRTLIT
jgi:hypothetical protein